MKDCAIVVLWVWVVWVCVVLGIGAALGYMWSIVLGFDEERWKGLCGGFNKYEES